MADRRLFNTVLAACVFGGAVTACALPYVLHYRHRPMCQPTTPKLACEHGATLRIATSRDPIERAALRSMYVADGGCVDVEHRSAARALRFVTVVYEAVCRQPNN